VKSQAVIGLGFGDEGKGMVVSSLVRPESLVVRYCGGPQAGHHVILKDGREHVFSHFGSGTLQGNKTYWSKYCTVDPIGIINERDDLIKKGATPLLFVDKECPVTTPFEKIYNKKADNITSHGSCGVGFGQTFKRQADHFSIRVSDFFHPATLKIKLQMLKEHYYRLLDLSTVDIDEFLEACEETIRYITVVDHIPNEDDIIFEGSQGLLLDQDIGFFPHVTRSNTGTKNITEMGFDPEIFLVTRAYQTRHGNGPMTNEGQSFSVHPNPYEKNTDDGFQGIFRRSLLDLRLMKYAIGSDSGLRVAPTLVITCMDQMEGNYRLVDDGGVISFNNERSFVEWIRIALRVKSVFLSRNPYPNLIHLFN
jgi:adenylosuccinate synthase